MDQHGTSFVSASIATHIAAQAGEKQPADFVSQE
jgi:hypothetical protein